MNREALFYDYIDKELDSEANQLSDVALVKRIGHGDEAAFGELYRRYSPSLFTYLVHMISEATAAEDVLQEVFLSVWKGAARFRGQASVKSWLFRITHHQAVTWLRKNHHHLQESEVDLAIDDDPEQAYLVTWTEETLRTALQALTPEQRAVVELTFFHGFSYAQIAEVLQCPLGTVKSRMSYSRKRMLRVLSQLRRAE